MLKTPSFEFANLQYFNSTFMKLKIVRLVLNAKCEIVVHAVFTSVIVLAVINKIYIVVHLVAYISRLSSNEEISKIEKTYLYLKHRQVFLVPDGQASL